MDSTGRRWGTRLSDFLGVQNGGQKTTRSGSRKTKPTKYPTLSQPRTWDDNLRKFSELVLADDFLPEEGDSVADSSEIIGENVTGHPEIKSLSLEDPLIGDTKAFLYSDLEQAESCGGNGLAEELSHGDFCLTEDLIERFMERRDSIGEEPVMESRKCHPCVQQNPFTYPLLRLMERCSAQDSAK